MKRNLVRSLLGIWFAGASALAMAEDIDLFVGKPGTEAANVLLVLDNGANFSSKADFPTCPGVAGWPTAMVDTTGGIEQCALYKVVEALPPDSVKLGVMIFNGGFVEVEGCTGNNGGCLAYPVTLMNETNKLAMLNWIKTWKVDNKDKGPGPRIKSGTNRNGAVMQEAWALFSGRTGLSGRTYDASLKPTSSCGKNYVIFVGNAFESNGTPSEGGNLSPKDALEGLLTSSGMNAFPVATTSQKQAIPGPIPVSCESVGSFTFPTNKNHDTGGFYADEWARYMKSQGIITYAVGLLGPSCKSSYEALLKSMSEREGGGKYFPTTNFEELKTAFETTLSEIQSVNSVFASVSLPVSVNTQGTYLNQVFVGMFRPDGDAAPRWYGNLKQYKLGYLNGTGPLKLLDADSQSAISSSGTGFIAECARSFWTPAKSAAGSNLYWANLETPNCGSYLAAADTPDGNMVEKGGQSFKLRGITPSERVVKTCDSNCSSSLANFTASNTAITKAALGDANMTDAARTELINWARGQNTAAERILDSSVGTDGSLSPKSDTSASAMMRPSSHGDVVHSRPIAINYAASDNDAPQIVVFYGANDGMLRAVNGNRDNGINVGGKGPGEELWSFVAPQSYGLFARLKANTPLVKFPNVTTGQPKAYGFDGPLTAYKTSSQAWIYATMRRGGRMLYAFDVTTPQSPSLKWRVGCPDPTGTTGCTTGFDGIGQTWAVPTVLKSAGYASAGVKQPMLIMGGGYDTCEDADPATSACKSSGKGHAIYLMDADTGALLNTFATEGGVIGDVTVVRDANDMAQYAYAADLNGNVYRISGSANAPIGNVAPANWVITKIASLGGTGNSARKFMFGPDVVVESGVHYLLLGSGDREKPVMDYPNAASVNNYFFMIKDQPTNATWLSSESSNCGAANLCLSSLYGITTSATPDASALDAKKGWYLGLQSREQVVTSGLTIFGTVYFSTHQPAATSSSQSCSANLGEARAYSVNFKNAEGLNGARYSDLVGDGLPPSPVGGLVALDNNGGTVAFCIGCDPESPLQGGEPPMPPTASQPKGRVFWNIEQ